MKASRTDQPRTRPVALRTKSACSPPDATVAIRSLLRRCLTAGQDEALDLLLAIHVDDRSQQLSLLVGAPRVDAQRAAQPVGAARLVDVTVQRQRRLVALDGLADRRRADGDRGAPRALEVHALRELRGVVEPRAVR